MDHASNLRMSTLCGIRNDELLPGEHSYVALTEETQAWVNCPKCRELLGLEPLVK